MTRSSARRYFATNATDAEQGLAGGSSVNVMLKIGSNQTPGAIDHLKKAAAGDDPESARLGRQALARLGQ